MFNTCPFCEVDALATVPHVERVKTGRKVVEVRGLSKMLCTNCGNETIPAEMFDANAKVVASTLENTSGAVSRGLLRKLREVWNISQRDASKLFGAGASSFAKWESGQTPPSIPSSLLIQCAAKFPEVMKYLASLSGVHLPSPGLFDKTAEWLPIANGQKPLYVSTVAAGRLRATNNGSWSAEIISIRRSSKSGTWIAEKEAA